MTHQITESVSIAPHDVVVVKSSWYHHEGTNDYTNSRVEIEEVVDRDGHSLQPVWQADWTALAEGVESRADRDTRYVRIFASACPVRARFRDFSEYVSYTDEEHSSSSTRTYWVRYVIRGDALE